jgi:hypothetical protein
MDGVILRRGKVLGTAEYSVSPFVVHSVCMSLSEYHLAGWRQG